MTKDEIIEKYAAELDRIVEHHRHRVKVIGRIESVMIGTLWVLILAPFAYIAIAWIIKSLN